ncbi:hypothetical protein [Acinetobacter tianfuensis]|uniref:Uncharacterized protein n=1 Tax=Acinetobacter tianfuensis TaxID=2419603 RepID=A0A3A8E292_9GAMM|nr:hypothetical protein [Acinetobacter tianfuensis]RKG29117.1 hypothetical protein D7V32_16475 [Acinetobacter tianfuensis]
MKLDPLLGMSLTLNNVLQKLDIICAYETDEAKRAQLLLINSELTYFAERFNEPLPDEYKPD